MLYCSECQLICEEERCPLCGSRKLRLPKDTDPVYAGTADFNQAALIEEILKDNEIPYLKASDLGSGITLRVGPGMDTYRFYVPYGALDKCKELLSDVFQNDGVSDAE